MLIKHMIKQPQKAKKIVKKGVQRLDRLEPFLPLILSLHGTLLLLIEGSSLSQWILVTLMAVLGLSVIAPKKQSWLLLRASFVLVFSWFMMYVHKGVASFFFFWMVVLVVMYAHYLPKKYARFLPIVAASSILLMGAVGQAVPMAAVLNKFLHLNIIGYLVFFLSLQMKKQFNELNLVKTELERQEAFYRHKSNHDALTELPNRRFLMQQLDELVEEKQMTKDSAFALFFIDIDNLKMTNDHWGHVAGDALIIETVERIRSCLPVSAMLARVAGDELAIIVKDYRSKQDAVDLAKDIIQAFLPKWSWESQTRSISVSIGISFSDDSKDVAALLRQADEAMYLAKAQGKARHVVFAKDPKLNAEKASSSELLS